MVDYSSLHNSGFVSQPRLSSSGVSNHRNAGSSCWSTKQSIFQRAKEFYHRVRHAPGSCSSNLGKTWLYHDGRAGISIPNTLRYERFSHAEHTAYDANRYILSELIYQGKKIRFALKVSPYSHSRYNSGLTPDSTHRTSRENAMSQTP